MACIQKKKEKEDDKKDNRTIITIPDELWDEIKVILPREKPLRNSGSANCTDTERYLMEFYTSLELGSQWKMLPKVVWFGIAHAIEGFRNGINWMFSKRHGFDY